MTRPPSAGMCSTPRKDIRQSTRDSPRTTGRKASKAHCGMAEGSACFLRPPSSGCSSAIFAASRKTSRPSPSSVVLTFRCAPPRQTLPRVAQARDRPARPFRRAAARAPQTFERRDLQLLPPLGDVALRERVLVPVLAVRALEALVRARLLLRQRQPRPRVAHGVAAPTLHLDQQHLARENDSLGHASHLRAVMSDKKLPPLFLITRHLSLYAFQRPFTVNEFEVQP